MVSVSVLGDLAIEVDGRPSDRITSHRARSLLAWLAVHPGMHPRGRVAGVFWPDVLEESARSSLTVPGILHERINCCGPRLVARSSKGPTDGQSKALTFPPKHPSKKPS